MPGLSECVGGKGANSVFFNKKIEEGSTVGDAIRKIAAEHQAFGEIILDAQTNKLSGGLICLLNDLSLEALNGLGAKIKDGDIIRLFPIIGGG
jgi:molybdopterin converting factor small subunit